MGDDPMAADQQELRRQGASSPHQSQTLMERKNMRKSIGGLAAIGIVATSLTLASDACAQTKITFQLNWVAGGANAGFAAAVAEGFYKDAGLDVTVVQGNGSANTAQLVASGRSQIAYADAVSGRQLIATGGRMKAPSN